MVVLGVKKGANHKKYEHGCSTIKSLPKELLVEIFAKIGIRSIVDLCMVKLCSKDFLHAAEDNYVYRHASMESLALVPLLWFTGEKEPSFLKRCKKGGNLEITYREGTVQYFTYLMVELGLENFKKATLEGHNDANYVYCMLLMCHEEERKRKQGFDIFCSLKASTCINRCKNRVKAFIQSIWVKNNNAVLRYHKFSFSGSCTCDVERVKNLSRRWSSFEDDVGSISFLCEFCCADYEVDLFCNMFGV